MFNSSVILSFPFCPTISIPNVFDNKRQDPTGLTAALQSTDLVGVVHTLYCILLHSFSPESASQTQEPYGPGVIQVAIHGIRFLNSFAILDLSAFQVFICYLNSFTKSAVFVTDLCCFNANTYILHIYHNMTLSQKYYYLM